MLKEVETVSRCAKKVIPLEANSDVLLTRMIVFNVERETRLFNLKFVNQ